MLVAMQVSLLACVVCIYGSQASLLDGLAEELLQEFPGESAEMVEHVLAQALEAASKREQLADESSCLRDYSKLCPQGWIEMEDGQTCSAPPSYQGACSEKKAFGNLDPAGKRGHAYECGAEYACIGKTPEDFYMPCPVGWSVDLDKHCIAPGSYMGPCVGRQSFAGLTVEDKISWGRICGVEWPTRSSWKDRQASEGIANDSSTQCRKDYTRPCPIGWVLNGNHCLSPSGYEDLCGPSWRASLTRQQKKAIEKACAVAWPCLFR